MNRIIIVSIAVLIAILIIGVTQLKSSQKEKLPPLEYQTGNAYDKDWKKVDSLTQLGLPRSAVEIVERIYNKSVKENNYAQIIKSLIYKMGNEYAFEEDAQIKSIQDMESSLPKISFPARPVIQSLLAGIYWRYYQVNRYRILQRTQTVGFDPVDIKTWDATRFVDKTNELYLQSLSSADSLQRTSLHVFDSILVRQDGSKNLRPTLYDFLAHRALGFFMNSETQLSRPAYEFTIQSPDYFSPTAEFVGINIKTRDSLSLHHKALLILQDLLEFHLEENNANALVDNELIRLNFIRSHSVNDLKDSLYLQSLQNLENRYKKDTITARVGFEIARYFLQQSSQYDQQTGKQFKGLKKQAFEKCDQVIQNYPSTLGANNCQALKEQILNKSLSLTVEEVNVPGKPFRGLLEYRNINEIYVRMVAVSRDQIENLNDMRPEDLADHLIKQKPASAWSVALLDEKDFNTHWVEIKLPARETGVYYALVSSSEDFTYRDHAIVVTKVNVSNLSYIQRRNTDNSLEFYVLDRASGHPLKGASVQLYYEYYDHGIRKHNERKGPVYKTDKNGSFQIPPGQEYQHIRLAITYKKDFLDMDVKHYIYKASSANKEKWRTKTFFFLDRAIYRPGQVVYFKGLVLETNGEENEIKTGHSTTVELLDVNYQKVSEVQVSTNEYGTFNGIFTIPSGGMNGNFRIKTASGTKNFRVEDYKRPRFEVAFDPVTGSFRLEDSVKVSGTAISYAGANIDHAEVKYRVVRQATFPFYPWYYSRSIYPVSPAMEIAHGVTETDAGGKFSISFKAIPDRTIAKKESPVFNYTVYADITDITGETRSSQATVNVGYVALQASIDMKEVIYNTAEESIEISTKNLNGEFEPATGTVSIYRLNAPEKVFRDRLWPQMPDQFLYSREEFNEDFPHDPYKDENLFVNWEKGKLERAYQFDTKERTRILLEEIRSWRFGKYVVELETEDQFGTPVTVKKYFSVYDPLEKVVPDQSLAWFYPVKGEGEPGETAKFLIGSAAKDVRVIYEIYNKEQQIDKKWVTLNNEVKTIEIPIQEAYRGNIVISLAFVKYGRSFTYTPVIKVPYSNKELIMEMQTFRDKLLPGQKEEWRLKITGQHGEKIAAEMLAGMYDASLDAFAANHWNLQIYNSYYYSGFDWQANHTFGTNHSNLLTHSWNAHQYSIKQQEYDRLNWFGFNFLEQSAIYYMRSRASGVMADDDMSVMAMTKSAVETAAAEPPAVNEEARRVAEAPATAEEKEPEEVIPRRNLQETAFFFPDLRTDEEGNVIIAFTIPEALTRWKFMGMAHTKDLAYGFINKEVVTQKELMVVPNPPRFLREQDEFEFTAKVNNLSGNELKGKAKLLLFDAVTMKPVDAAFGNANAEKDFTAPQGQSARISWSLKIPAANTQAVTYRVVASAGKFSDGEESILPVLTNSMLVTETLPLNVRSKETKTFSFDKLVTLGRSRTLRHHKLTLEFTSNPAWYAIQALPYLMEYPYDCTEQIFNRYYANSLAANIANSSPNIRRVFESWKNTDALLSNLEKNEELKSLLLEETPWVLDAKDETERKKRVALLFDMNNMAQQKTSALKKLIETQSPNGGWPWFKGMPDNRYITQYIVTGTGRLDHLGSLSLKQEDNLWNAINKAVKYLDERIAEDYQYLRTHDIDLEQDNLGYLQIQYLYARSFYKDVNFTQEQNEAYKYYQEQAKKYWLKKNKYSQGMIAIALHRDGVKDKAMDIIRSLKETSTTSEELGMYWKSNKSGYYWYQAPIETQALLIEAFKEVADDQKSVDEMRVWLLKQKQVQSWGTTKATADACYALLLEGTQWLTDTELAKIKVGKISIDPSEKGGTPEAGTGYFKTSWSGNEINTTMGKITVTNPNNVIGWGAIYWQYFEQLDKITPAETPLSLKKQLFLQQNADAGPVMKPVNSKTTLRPGDLITVRIELRVDRDMEFVHMKDMRASGFEPVNVLSGYRWKHGLGYYESTRDAATNFFFDRLPKGTYVFEYNLRVAHNGNFSNGITTIQSMYAPEFSSHSEGVRVEVGD